jgi:hypothetical protein
MTGLGRVYSRLIERLRDWRPLGVSALIIVGILVVHRSERGSLLNIAGLTVLLCLFVACVLVVPRERLDGFYAYLSWTFAVGTLFNLAYELLHSPLYSHFHMAEYTQAELVEMLFISALADGFIVWLLVLGATILRCGHWDDVGSWAAWQVAAVLVMALLIQFTGERVALANDEWAYVAPMPVVFGVGLTPLVQMALLFFPTVWLARRLMRRS